MSASQIKQIAGRAGRYGTQKNASKEQDEEATGGVVTTLQDIDLPVLRAAIASPMKQIHHAAIQLPPEQMELLTTMLSERRMALSKQEIKEEADKQAKKKQFSRGHRDRRNNEDSLASLLDNLESGDDAKVTQVPTTRLSDVYTDMALFCDIDTKNFYLSDFRQQAALAPIVAAASSVSAVQAAQQGRQIEAAQQQVDSTSLLTIAERSNFLTVSKSRLLRS